MVLRTPDQIYNTIR